MVGWIILGVFLYLLVMAFFLLLFKGAKHD